jgi:hypothetical protein
VIFLVKITSRVQFENKISAEYQSEKDWSGKLLLPN